MIRKQVETYVFPLQFDDWEDYHYPDRAGTSAWPITLEEYRRREKAGVKRSRRARIGAHGGKRLVAE